MAKKLRPGSGYRTAASFQTTTIIYAATYWFCEKFLDSRSAWLIRWYRLPAPVARILPIRLNEIGRDSRAGV